MLPVTSYENQVPTGDAPLVPFVYFIFRCPAALWFQSAMIGQFINQVLPSAWAYVGEITPDEAAEAATQLYESVRQVFIIGSIVPFGGALPTDGSVLACDGASYLRDDYPDLFAVIGTTWGSVDSSHFNVPDLRGRSLVGAGTGSGLSPRALGQEFGEETHQLTVAELASHTHTEGTTAPIPALLAPPDGVSAIGASGVTGSTGGDTPHNNMQPSAVITFGIVAK